MAKAKKTKDNFFVRFWNGQLSLPMSYWGVGVGIGILFSILVVIIIVMLGMHDDAMWGFIIPFQIYTVVGIWRSADRYKGTKLWAILAKIAVVIGVISNFASMLTGY
tara:strand:- start:731 stop:1051 length:321 start_codon:yes stop_codon:yes gene_type:complete